MLKNSLRELGPEFGFLAENDNTEAEQNVMNRLDRSVKLDEVDTVTFGLETDDGKIVKVYVKADEAEDFERALSDKLGEIDDIEEVLNELSKEYEIIDVEWPSEDSGNASDDDEAEADGSESLNQKVYDNPKEKAQEETKLRSKMESLTIGERLTIRINEDSDSGTIESRFTTASQLMVYHALLELGIPELALSRSAFRAEIMKNIKNKALELSGSPTMKSALKTFINRSIDYEDKAKQNKTAISGEKAVKESLVEGVTQDFWGAVLELVNYIAASPEDSKQLMTNPSVKQLMTRSSSALSSNVSPQLKTKLIDFKNSLSSDGSTAALKSAGVSESRLSEGSSASEVTSLFKSLFMLADTSKDGVMADSVMKSSAWNSFFNGAKSQLTQKFSGVVRSKLNQLKAVLPSTANPGSTTQSSANTTTPTSESNKSFMTALNLLDMVDTQFSTNRVTEANLGDKIEYRSYNTWKAAVPRKSTFHKAGKLERSQSLSKDFEGVSGTWNAETNTGWVYSHYLNKKNLAESQVPDWTFEEADENVVIKCSALKVTLNPEEVEKLLKGITNKDTVIVRDVDDQTHKVAFSPRGSSVMVKKVGTTEGVMMKQKDVNSLLAIVNKEEEPEVDPKEEPEDQR